MISGSNDPARVAGRLVKPSVSRKAFRRDGRDIPLSEAFEKANRCEGLSVLRRGQAQSAPDIHCVKHIRNLVAIVMEAFADCP